MRTLARILMLFSAACTTMQRSSPVNRNGRDSSLRNGVLHVHVSHTAAYCGGADPGPGGMPRPEPWRGHMFLRAATPDSTGTLALNDLGRPILDTIRTDATDNGHLSLPAGHYLLLDQDRVDDQRYRTLLKDHARPTLHTAAIDKACLDQWLHGPFGVVHIREGDTTRVDMSLFDQCPWYSIPCVHYHGPLPP